MLSIFSKTENLDAYVNARAMRLTVLFWLFNFCLLLISFSSTASVPPTSNVVQVESFAQLKVGDSIDSRAAGAPRHAARFYFYLLRSDLPSRCLNLQCGRFARKIMMRNGFLIGGGDQELAKEVGLDISSGDSDRALLIVTDRSGKVTHLFKNVASGSLDAVLDQISSQ
jgi:hypothetical protein